MGKAQTAIHVASDLSQYFQEQIQDIAQKQRFEISPFAQSYLARVLSRFSNSESFFNVVANSESGKTSFPTLALLWLEGLGRTHPEQLVQMQQLGDLALFTSGFFGEKIRGSLVDLDYYLAMGEKAYERAAVLRETIAAEKALNVFFELSAGFSRFVEVFAELSEQSLLANDQALLKLYEKWLASGSSRIGRMLNERGVIPAKTGNDKN